MAQFKVMDSKFGEFKKALRGVNKRLAKYDTEITILCVQDRPNSYLTDSGLLVSNIIKMVTLSEPRVNGKSGVTFLGIVSYIDGVPAIFTSENAEGYILNEYASQSFSCDHCHSTRHRTKVFFFLENGEVKRVGSSCVKEWFGLNLNAIFSAYGSFCETYGREACEEEEDEGMMCRNRNPTHIDMRSLVDLLSVATLGFKLPWKKAMDPESTSELMLCIMNSDHPDPRLGQLSDERIDTIIAKAEETWAISPSSDFEFNVVENLLSEGKARHEVHLSRIAVVAWAIWKANQAVLAVPLGVNEYLGAVGEKITFTAKPKCVYSYEARYTYNSSQTTFIYVFTTPLGDVKWSTSMVLPADTDEEYTEVTLTGKVKALEEFKGRKQTTVTRCKLVS